MLVSDNQSNKRRTPYYVYVLVAAALVAALSVPSSSSGLANYLAYWIDNATLNYTNLTVQGIGTWYFETAPYNNTTSTVSLYVSPATVFSDGYMTSVQATALAAKALGSSCSGDNGTAINVTMNATTAGVQCVEVLKATALPSVIGNVTGNGMNGTTGYHVYQTSTTALKTSNLSENQFLLTYPNSLLIDGGTLIANSTTNQVGINTTQPTSTLDVSGNLSVTQNLNVDGKTLYADAANNNVSLKDTQVNGNEYVTGNDNASKQCAGVTCVRMMPVTMVQLLNVTSGNAGTPFNVSNELNFSMEANKNYTIDCDIYYQTSVSTTGIGLSFDGPTGAKQVVYTAIIPTSATATFYGVGTAYNTSIIGTAVPSANSTSPARLWGDFYNGNNAGQLRVTFRSETASGNNATLLSGSTCTVLELFTYK